MEESMNKLDEFEANVEKLRSKMTNFVWSNANRWTCSPIEMLDEGIGRIIAVRDMKA